MDIDEFSRIGEYSEFCYNFISRYCLIVFDMKKPLTFESIVMDIDCDGNIDSTIDNNINARIIFDNKNVNDNEGDCNDNLIANKLFLIIIFIVIVVLVIQFDLQIEFS
ncbi:hypothetical protein DERP_004258 [Dermatophagoides pteronyssinus]|uniref:Uncharacterized protein n=1 Tax=Dermatophagoides pteronyssinus TaxID=6956 RepID=A0ABQ8J962_DERPT|nr:hypothetical protein DERP_004258 [Dermatophagoides pteronyssinus]